MQSPVALFREISPYVHQHNGRIFVIALSGEVVEQGNFIRLVQDIAILSSLGVKLVLIHGSRPQIETRLARQGQSGQFHKNIRITDTLTLHAVQEACGYLRIQIEHLLTSALNQPMINNKLLSVVAGNFISARPLGVHDGVDYQNTGHIRRIHSDNIQQQLQKNNIVLLSPIGYSPSGQSYNLSYEETAVATANALSADKLIFIHHEALNLPTNLTHEEARQHSQQHHLLNLITQPISENLKRIHLINSLVDGSLLLELFTVEGQGCMITPTPVERIRQAQSQDISVLRDLLRPLEEKGVLVKRSHEQLEREINQFQVVELDQQIIGCAALYDTDQNELGELACFIIHPQHREKQRGNKLLQRMQTLAKQQNKQRLLVLTTQTSDWFKEHGFIEYGLEDLPPNKKQLYNYKRNSKVLIKSL